MAEQFFDISASVDGAPSQDPAGGGTSVLEREEQRQAVEPGDHERFKHFVDKHKLTEAMINGTPVVALCGKVWVPSRDPERFPMCPSCQEIWESMSDGDDDSGSDKGGSGGGFFGFGRRK